MFRKSVIAMVALSIAVALPAPLLARATMHWYLPHYLPSVDEASNRLQFLSPHFAPVTSDAEEDLTTGYSLQRVDVNKLGINLSFTKSGVNQSSQYYWSWWGGYVAPVTTPYKDDIVVSIVYADVTYFEIYNNERAEGYPATWCVDYIHRHPAGNSTICVPTEADAHAGGCERPEPGCFPCHILESLLRQRFQETSRAGGIADHEDGCGQPAGECRHEGRRRNPHGQRQVVHGRTSLLGRLQASSTG
jgi:hypothetical protein